MNWWKRPEAGVWLHLAVSIAPILINIFIAFITDPSNPLGLNASVLALVVTLANVLLSQLRNNGQHVTTVERHTNTTSGPDLAAGSTIVTTPQSQ